MLDGQSELPAVTLQHLHMLKFTGWVQLTPPKTGGYILKRCETCKINTYLMVSYDGNKINIYVTLQVALDIFENKQGLSADLDLGADRGRIPPPLFTERKVKMRARSPFLKS